MHTLAAEVKKNFQIDSIVKSRGNMSIEEDILLT